MKTKRKTSKTLLKNKRKLNAETDFLLSTKTNTARLSDSIKQDKIGKVVKKGN